MQAFYDRAFERDMGLAESEFRRCLPGAFEPHVLQWSVTPGEADIALPSGHARVTWHALPPRVIAMATLPRVHVRFDFGSVDEGERQRVMKRFDLVMLRGGG
jgi:hypothetical protein